MSLIPFFFRWGFVIDDVIDVDTTFALPNQGSFITGSTFSIHDQHIERLWHDVFVGFLYIYMYYSLFCYLEEGGYLDVGNDIHITILSTVFVFTQNQQTL